MARRDEDKANAHFQEQSLAQWRDWRHYLTIHLQLLVIQTTPTEPLGAVFEIDEHRDPEQVLREQLAGIPVEARLIFDRAVAERREREQRRLDAERRERGDRNAHPVDGDEVDRATYTALLEDAEGTHDPAGIGVVPLGDGWYDVDAEQLRQDAPAQASYRIAGVKGKFGAKQIVIGVAMICVAALAIYLTLPHASPVVMASAPVTVQVDDQRYAPWVSQELVIPGPAPVRVPLVTRTAYTATSADGWYDPTTWPLTICTPATVKLLAVQQIELTATENAPTRHFVLRDGPIGADVALVPCDGTGVSRYGTLREVTPPPALALGTAAQLDAKRSATLTALHMIGGGEDTALPAGKAQVVAIVTATNMDWSKVNAVLRWPDGQELLPSSATPEADGTVNFRYLVPAPDGSLAAVQWQIVDPTTSERQRWETTLAAPQSREQRLATALRDVQVRAEQSAVGDLVVTLSLTNSSRAALQLSVDDVLLMQANRRQPTPPLDALRDPLQPDETRTVALTLTLPAQALTVQIGGASFRIEP